MKRQHFSTERRTRRGAAGVFVIVALFLTGVGYWSYRAEEKKITTAQYQTLAAIGELKSGQIQQWRKERRAEIARAAKDSLTLKAVQNALAAPGSPSAREAMQECLQEEMEVPDRCGTLLYDCNAKLMASNDPARGPLDEATRRAMREALANHAPAFSDFYRASDGLVHIDLAAPVQDRDGVVLAILVLRHEAASYLYPLIQSRLTPGRSEETNLVKRDGNDVVFLNDVRQRGGAALTVRLPLRDERLAAAQAVLGKQGIFLGTDYRGIEVVSDLRAVAGSPWFIVSKVDAAEIGAEVHAKAAGIALIVGLFILLSAALVALYYRGRQTRMMADLIAAEQRKAEALDEARAIGERHRTILLATMDGFWLVDPQGRINEVNAAYCRMSGYSEAEILRMSVADPEAILTPEDISSKMRKIVAQGGDRFETQQRRKDGSLMDVEVSIQCLPSDGLMAGFIRDITARKQAEARIARLSMLYAALSECNNAIVHAASAAELMPRICRTVVEQGGFKMAWIATPDPTSGKVSASASYGQGLEYLAQIGISTNPDVPTGQGPAGTAIREGIPVWCHDFQNDPRLEPWRGIGLRFGWQSGGAIPLRLGRKSVGALIIYSDIAEAFDEEIRALLAKWRITSISPASIMATWSWKTCRWSLPIWSSPPARGSNAMPPNAVWLSTPRRCPGCRSKSAATVAESARFWSTCLPMP